MSYGRLAPLGALAVVFVTAIAFWRNGISDLYRDTLTPVAFGLWYGSLLLAVLAPPAIAIGFWYAAARTRYGWVFHLLLCPATYALVRGLIGFMLSIAHEPDSDGPTGWATDPAILLTLACPAIYFCALGFARIRRRVARQNGN